MLCAFNLIFLEKFINVFYDFVGYCCRCDRFFRCNRFLHCSMNCDQAFDITYFTFSLDCSLFRIGYCLCCCFKLGLRLSPALTVEIERNYCGDPADKYGRQRCCLRELCLATEITSMISISKIRANAIENLDP